MLTAIKYNLSHLTDFKGRDARSTFWYYVLFLVLVQIALSFAISIPLTGAMVGDAVVAARQGVSEQEVQARMMAHVGGMMRASMWLSVVLTVLVFGLLVAAFTRRLHDSGKPGWIAAITAVIQLIVVMLTITSIDDTVAMMAQVQQGAGGLQGADGVPIMPGNFLVQSVLAWVPSILVVVFGVWPSAVGENRYGPQPLPS